MPPLSDPRADSLAWGAKVLERLESLEGKVDLLMSAHTEAEAAKVAAEAERRGAEALAAQLGIELTGDVSGVHPTPKSKGPGWLAALSSFAETRGGQYVLGAIVLASVGAPGAAVLSQWMSIQATQAPIHSDPPPDIEQGPPLVPLDTLDSPAAPRPVL